VTIWTPRIDPFDGPKYLAIAAAIAADIDRGRLRPGDRLPPHRDLADRLRVTVGTVSRGYAEAERRGLLRGEVGRGTFVQRPEAADLGLPGPPADGIIDLSLNLPFVPAAGGAAQALESTLADLAGRAGLRGLVGYQPGAGARRHREAGAAWVARSGLAADPARVLVCAGVQHAMVVVFSALLAPGDVLLTESLTYPGMKALAALLHLRLRGVDLDEHGIVPESFDAACRAQPARALYTVPDLQNPTGSVMPEGRRREIAEIARRHGVAVVEDDCYGYLLEAPPAPIAAFLPDQAYFLVSLAKTVAPGLRIGYLHAPASAVSRLDAGIRTTCWMAAPLMAEIAASWIADGTAERLLLRTREETTARRALAGEILARRRFDAHRNGCHLWLHLPEPWHGAQFASAARSRGVAVTPPEAFTAGRGEAPHAVRVCLGAAADRDQLARGLRLVDETLDGAPAPYLSMP
jgi:DNA-binding transcriptional MocR family regulator